MIEQSDVEAFHYVHSANLSENRRRMVVICDGSTDEMNSFLLDHGFVTASAKESDGNLWIEYKRISEL